ncbi:ATP dependent DNA ligase-like protein [Georgenia soli]|uniref:ATP dependent DNA ligase-like protein n=1 Tax=Georgenia soli TaxID=638953 RepID=A0A2A9F382_9MICO|nr:ATP-dependent DNA ligase [Georgenia soli]PFG44879.1 ATP dependent DNA ligase-like protein [Georgenia soli]
MSSTLPEGLRGPVDLALARAVEKLPAPGTLPGGLIAEPKWDGYRASVVRDGDSTVLWSRQRKDLTRYFPDLYAAAATAVPPGCVLDGEIVVFTDGRLNFSSLQHRMTSSKRALADLIRREPASYVAFDILAVAYQDVRHLPLRDRRNLLEELASDWEPPMQISPITTDTDEARRWLDELHVTGVEGLILKGAAQPYRGSKRDWLKVKHRDTAEVVCGAVIGTLERPEALIAGLVIDGRLRIVGRTTPLHAGPARALSALLHPPAGEHPWPTRIPRGALDRFARDKEPIDITLVDPLVIEVTADVAWSGTSYRHPLRYVRARLELQIEDVIPPR